MGHAEIVEPMKKRVTEFGFEEMLSQQRLESQMSKEEQPL